MHLKPALHSKRRHHNEKPVHRNEEQPLLDSARENPSTARKEERKKIISSLQPTESVSDQRGFSFCEGWLVRVGSRGQIMGGLIKVTANFH